MLTEKLKRKFDNSTVAGFPYGYSYTDELFGEIILGHATGEQDDGFDIYEVWFGGKKHFWNSHAVSVIGRWTT